MKKTHLIYAILALVVVLVVAGFWYAESDVALRSRIQKANELGKLWIFSNMREEGLFVYSMHPAEDTYSTSNNAIRQLMASRVLAQESAGSEEVARLHRLNLDFLFEFWYREDGDVGYVLFDDKSKLGANAMLLRTLVYSPFFDEYEEEAEALARGILALQHEDGSFDAWYIAPSYGFDEERLLTFYSGEALLGLVEYYERTQEEAWLAAAELSADFYLGLYVANLEENYYPAYVPWHTLAYNKLYKITGDQTYADAIFVLNDKLLELLDLEKPNKGRFYNPAYPQYGTPHASSDGVYTEGFAYAYEIAVLVEDELHEEAYREALELAFHNLEALQYQEPVIGYAAESARYLGALRVRDDNPEIRVDTTQHTVDALTKILEVL